MALRGAHNPRIVPGLRKGCQFLFLGLNRPLSNSPSTKSFANQEIIADCNYSLQYFQEKFQTRSIRYSFGYGLGVFPQEGYEKSAKKPQIDVVHVVNNVSEFHATNVAQFPNHYSFMRLLGLPAITRVQLYGAGMYYNPYVRIEDDRGHESMIKYGIVSEDVIFQDLTEWSTFYLAGRLQKPVRHIFGADLRLERANEYNLESAFNLSLVLLCLGKKISLTTRDLYQKIALLSYMGDPRMIVGGENPNKVKNIVKRQMAYFEQLYDPAMQVALSKGYATLKEGNLIVPKDASVFADILAKLPIQFRLRLAQSYGKKYEYVPEAIDDPNSKFLKFMSSDTHLRRTLLTTVLAIIAYPALVQSLKGILTAGIVKSAKYAWEKKMKSLVKT